MSTQEELKAIARGVRYDVIRLAASGHTPEEIADKLGISIMVARAWGTDGDLRNGAPSHKKRANHERVKLIKSMQAMRRKGMSDVKIAEAHGLSKQTVHAMLGRRYGKDFQRKQTEARGIRLMSSSWDRLEGFAKDLGFVKKNGDNVGDGSIPLMLEGVARGELIIANAKIVVTKADFGEYEDE